MNNTYRKTIPYTLTGVLLASISFTAQAEWNFRLAPYLWAANLGGTTSIAGRDIDFDASFDDLVSSLDAGGALRFEAETETWGLFADGFIVKLKDDRQTIAGTLVDFSVKQEIMEGGVSYRFSEQLKIYGGARYQKVDVDVTFQVIGDRGNEDSWTDAIIGLQWEPINTNKWALGARADIGAGGSDSVWLIGVGGGYHFNDTVSLLLAYRYLDTEYESNQFKWDVSQSGFGIGLGFHW